jgi:hypothetical protein
VIHDRVFIHHWETEFERLAGKLTLEFQPKLVAAGLE